MADAFAVMESTGDRWWEAELHGLNAEALGLWTKAGREEKGALAEAERHLHWAMEVGQRQGAKSLELQAATSFATLWQRRDERRWPSRCWPASTVGLPRDSIRRISSGPVRFWQANTIPRSEFPSAKSRLRTCSMCGGIRQSEELAILVNRRRLYRCDRNR